MLVGVVTKMRSNLSSPPTFLNVSTPLLCVYTISIGFLNIRSADHDSIPFTQTQDVQLSCDSLVPVTIPLHVYRQAIQQVYCGVL